MSFCASVLLLSVCRLWRNCARRVLRTQQQLAWVSACGPSNAEVHALCSILSEELEVNRCTHIDATATGTCLLH